jgi:hypothetical protein
MAHYAFLDENNMVTEVIPGIDETELIEGLTPEEWYGKFRGQKCVRTSYNGNIRKNFATVGGFYDVNWDVFIPVRVHPDWVLDYTTYRWIPPTPEPDKIEGHQWIWSDYNNEWVSLPISE